MTITGLLNIQFDMKDISPAERVAIKKSFPKSARLRKRADFIHLARSANKQNRPGFLVVWLENGHNHARLGITVSRRVGTASVRNRIKRFVREVYRVIWRKLPPVDINVIARRDAAFFDYKSVNNQITDALTHIGDAKCSKNICSS